MKTATVHLKPAGDGKASSIVIDGHELANTCLGIAIRQRGCDIPTVDLDLLLKSIDVTVTGELMINATPINDDIGRQILKALLFRYRYDA